MNRQELLTPRLEENFLKDLHGRYVRKFGHLPHKIDEYEFFITERYEVISLRISESETWVPVLEITASLEKKGFINFSESRLSFFLTEQGYRYAEMDWKAKLLTWLNSNQGIIAGMALVVSVASLLLCAC